MPPDASAALPPSEDLPAVVWDLLDAAREACPRSGASTWGPVPEETIRDIALPLHVALVLVVAAAPPGGDPPPGADHVPDNPARLREILEAICGTPRACEDVAALRDKLSKLVKALAVKASPDPTSAKGFCTPCDLAGGRLRAAYTPQEQAPSLRQLFNVDGRAYGEPIAPLDRFRGYTLVLQGPAVLEHRPAVPGTWDSCLTRLRGGFPRVWLAPVGGLDPNLEGWEHPVTKTLYFRLTPGAPFSSQDALTASLEQLARVRHEGADARDLLVLPELSLTLPDLERLNVALLELRAPYLGLVAGMTHTEQAAGSRWVRNTAQIHDGSGYRVWEQVKRGPYRIKARRVPRGGWLDRDLLPRADQDVWEGLVPGRTLTWANTRWGRLGVLICADLLEERWPSMRDLVRLARLDLLILVCWTERTAPFDAHLEQLARLGVGGLAVNHAFATRPHRPGELPLTAPARWSALAWFPSWGTPARGRPNAFCWTREHPDEIWSRTPGQPWARISSEEARGWGVQVVAHAPALVVDMDIWLRSQGRGGGAVPTPPRHGQGVGGAAPEGSAGGYTQGVTPGPSNTAGTEGSLPAENLGLLDEPTQEGPIPPGYSDEQILHWIESGLVEVMEPLAYGAPPVWGLTVRGERLARAQREARGEQPTHEVLERVGPESVPVPCPTAQVEDGASRQQEVEAVPSEKPPTQASWSRAGRGGRQPWGPSEPQVQHAWR